SMSHAASASGHLATSSAQAAANCGPRKRSGSEADSTVASAPLGQMSRLPVSRGASPGGCSRSRPLSPSTMMAIASLIVSPTSAMGDTGWGPVANARIHSAPARVLPEPRPPMTSQVTQSPGGGNCSGRAHSSHSNSNCSASAGRNAPATACASDALKLRNALGQLVAQVADVLLLGDRLGRRGGLVDVDQLFERAHQLAEHGDFLLA